MTDTGMSAKLTPSVLMGIKNLMVRARTVVEGALVGEHISPFRGGSVEFAQHRSYSPGDELRYVDWRLYARTDEFHVKQFDVNTNLRAYLLIDGSGSMGYPDEGPVSKYSYAAILAGAISYVLVQQSDAVSLSVNRAGDVTHLPPRGQVAYLQQLLNVLDERRPEGREDILGLLRFAQERITNRSLVVLFSDFFVDVEKLMANVRVLQSRGHDLIVFQILHPDELEFPFNRFYRFESMEDERHLVADSQQIRELYLEALEEHQAYLRREMSRVGADFRIVRTDEPPDRVLSRHLNSPLRARKLRKMF